LEQAPETLDELLSQIHFLKYSFFGLLP